MYLLVDRLTIALGEKLGVRRKIYIDHALEEAASHFPKLLGSDLAVTKD